MSPDERLLVRQIMDAADRAYRSGGRQRDPLVTALLRCNQWRLTQESRKPGTMTAEERGLVVALVAAAECCVRSKVGDVGALAVPLNQCMRANLDLDMDALREGLRSRRANELRVRRQAARRSRAR